MTPSGWETVALSEVMSTDIVAVPVEPNDTYRLAGVYSFARGLFDRDPLRGSDTSYGKLHRLHAGHLVLSRLKGWEGALALVGEDFDGAHLSPEFPTLKCDHARILPGYAWLLFQQPSFWESLQSRSTGMGGRKTRVKAEALLEVVVDIPSLQAQQRIIDLVEHIATSIGRARHHIMCLAGALDALREDLLSAGEVNLSDVVEVGSGPSWKAADESPNARPNALPVLKITNTRPDGTVDLSEVAYVTGLPETTRLIDKQSLVLIRTNGNRDRIGNVYIPPDDTHGFAVSAFQMVAHVADGYDRQLLYHVLSRPSMQRRMSEAASGSTGLGNLSVRWLRQLQVPPPEVAPDVLPVLMACQSSLAAARIELQALQGVKKAVVRELLSGDREIPASYDRLLPTDAA